MEPSVKCKPQVSLGLFQLKAHRQVALAQAFSDERVSITAPALSFQPGRKDNKSALGDKNLSAKKV